MKKRVTEMFEFIAKLEGLVYSRFKKQKRNVHGESIAIPENLEHVFGLVKRAKKRESLSAMIGSRRKLLGSVAMLLIIVVLVATLAPGDLKAQNYNKTWTTTADFNGGTNSNINTASDQAQLATSTSSFSEGFTNTTYKDATMDANWDTTNHLLNLPGDPASGTANDLESKWKSIVGVSEYVQNMAYDSTNHFMYIGGASGSFGAYDTTTGAITNLTSKISSDWSTSGIYTLRFDSTNGVVYLGGPSAKFGAFKGGANPAAGTWYYLNSKITSSWSTYEVDTLAFDSTNGIIYLGGQHATFGSFVGGATPSAGTFTYLNSKIATDWSTEWVNALSYDSTNHIMYLGGSNSKFGSYTCGADPSAGTWANLSAKMNWGINYVTSMAFDSTNAKVYAVGETGRFGCFTGGSDPANGTFTSLDAKIQAVSVYAIVRSVVFDSTNGIIYAGTDNGKFASFAGGSNPAAVSAVDLTAKISTDWGANSIKNMTFDSTASKVYLSSTSAVRAGNYLGTANPANGTWTNLTLSTFVGFLTGYPLTATVYDSVNGFIYLGGSTGQLAAYKISDGTITNLTSKISGNWSTNYIYKLCFDSTNGIVYLGGDSGSFGAFAGGSNPSAGTWTSLTTKINTDWSTNIIYSLSFDSTNNQMYLGGANGKFGAFAVNATPSAGTWTYLNSKITADWSTNAVQALSFDSTNGQMYLGSSTGKFGAIAVNAAPANDTWVYLTAKISSDWSTNLIDAICFDSTNRILYIGGGNGKFGAIAVNATPANDTWTYLTAKISADWSTNTIYSLAFAAGKVFLAGVNSRLGVFTGGAAPSSGTWFYLTPKINGWWPSTTSVIDMAYVPSTANLYMSGGVGQLSSFLAGYSSNKNGISTKINSTTQTILRATLTATATAPANTAITYYLSSNGGSTWNAVSSGVEYTFTTATSDLRWKANLTTTDASVTPQITAITISYSYLTSNSGTMDLIYDATQAVVPTLLSWNDALPANTALTVKIRSASTSNGLSAATWSDTKSAADTPVNLLTINVGGVTGVLENQFSEVYATFTTTDGLSTPVLADITEQYVINQAPQIQTLTASQTTDGSKMVNIAYQLKDPDTSTNPYNKDGITVSYQYSINSGSTWSNCSTVTNSGLLAVSDDGSWTNKTAAWNIGTDLASSYYSGIVEVRVNANDNEQAHNTASLTSSAFSIDTKNPALGAIGSNNGIQIGSGTSWVNSATVNLTLSSADDSAKFMEIRNDNSFTGTKEAYSTSKIGWTLSAGDAIKTVYARFYDAYGNYTDAFAQVLLDTTPPAVPTSFTIFDTSDRNAGTFSATLTWNIINDPGDFSVYSIERSTDNSHFTEEANFSNIATDAYTDRGLSNANTYYYRIRSKDIHSNNSAFTTTLSLTPTGSDTTAPTISGPGPTSEGLSTSANITWLTSEPSDSYVEFGTSTGYGNQQGTDDLVSNHSVTIIGLAPTTEYHYRVKSRDAAGNRVTSADYTFSTTLPDEANTGVTITGATAQKPGADPEEVTIIWTTDRYASSQVLYGKTDALASQTSEDPTLNKTHYVEVTKLDPNTKYYYKVKSVDTYGNVVLGDLKYFVTSQSGLSSPTISKVVASNITMNSAIISWETTTVTTSEIQYGKSDTYGQTVDDQSLGSTTKHVIKLENLESGIQYNFRAMGQGTASNWVASDNYVFSTVPVPVISSVTTSDAKPTEMTVSWKTNSPTDSYVDFGIGNFGSSQGKSDLTTDHSVTLTALSPDTAYQFRAKSRDNYGNSTNSETSSFSTPVDRVPPVIDNLKSSTNIFTTETGNSQVQAIISWVTDKPSSTQLKYSEGIAIGGNYGNATKEDLSMTTSHVVILNNLKPSSAYHMQAISHDASNNNTVSKDYVVLTKRQDQSLLQTVVAQLQDTFGWVKKIKLF